MIKVLFVCMGNICRSPLAEGIARQRFREPFPQWQFDSAGIGNWHCGEAPDPRAIAVAARHGIDISGLRARQVTADDFARFDLILCADHDNLAALHALRRRHSHAHCDVLLRYLGHPDVRDVPDPYYGGSAQFSEVFALLSHVMDALRQRLVDHNPGCSATMPR